MSKDLYWRWNGLEALYEALFKVWQVADDFAIPRELVKLECEFGRAVTLPTDRAVALADARNAYVGCDRWFVDPDPRRPGVARLKDLSTVFHPLPLDTVHLKVLVAHELNHDDPTADHYIVARRGGKAIDLFRIHRGARGGFDEVLEFEGIASEADFSSWEEHEATILGRSGRSITARRVCGSYAELCARFDLVESPFGQRVRALEADRRLAQARR